jgi:hypothetical protein
MMCPIRVPALSTSPLSYSAKSIADSSVLWSLDFGTKNGFESESGRMRVADVKIVARKGPRQCPFVPLEKKDEDGN